MAPSWWKVPANRLRPCSEFLTEACDTAPHDGCCSATPCKLCLELETYADGISYGTATFGGSSWTGTVGGLAFVSYWERDAYGDCEYVVTLDGEEVYRATCYGGASCRDPGGSVGVLIGYDEGTLTWAKHEPRPLAVTTDPDTGCNDFFCGTCRCSCECLCVTITEVGIVTGRGEICTTSYPCDAPIWEGTVGDYDLSIALGRDQYTGECIITMTANGGEQDPVFVTGCADMSASVTLYDGTVISVRCKQCSCDQTDSTTCCEGRCFPGADGIDSDCAGTPEENPLPTTLTVEMSTDDTTYGCFSGSTTVALVAAGRWSLGTINATCVWKDPTNSTLTATWHFCAQIAIQCTSGGGWGIEFRRCTSETIPYPDFIPADSTLTKVSCDPVLLEGTVCYTPGMQSVVFPIIPPLPPIQHPDICLSFLV